MQFIKNNLVTIGVIAACAVALFVYANYFTGTPSAEVLVAQTATSSSVAPNLIASISQLQAVTLDPSLFSDPVFNSLVDFGVVIPAVPVGRSNPFAPLGKVSVASSGNIAGAAITSSSSKQTKLR